MTEKSYPSIKSVFSELVRQYSNPNYKNEKGQNLIFRDYTWNMEDLDSLIKNGFNINSTDDFGKTPIFYCKDKIQFRFLLLFGADINHLDNEGKNLLFYINDPENVRLMLKLDINRDTNDIRGHTFLSHELFHSMPHEFSQKINFAKKIDVQIFQVFKDTHKCLNLLYENNIKFHLSNKIHFHFDPLSEPELFEDFRNSLKKISFRQDTKFTFYSGDSNVCNLYTLRCLEKTISKG